MDKRIWLELNNDEVLALEALMDTELSLLRKEVSYDNQEAIARLITLRHKLDAAWQHGVAI